MYHKLADFGIKFINIMIAIGTLFGTFMLCAVFTPFIGIPLALVGCVSAYTLWFMAISVYYKIMNADWSIKKGV